MAFYRRRGTVMIKGLRTVKYPVADLARAKAWFSEAFDCAPYFDQPFYVGFAIGGFELGLVPDGVPGTAGSVAYWGVDDIEAAVARLLALGRTCAGRGRGRRHPRGGIAGPVREHPRPDPESAVRSGRRPLTAAGSRRIMPPAARPSRP
jgi:catechol 2,3-dioxygenase-like lactoylglutathione lyase family enzyme